MILRSPRTAAVYTLAPSEISWVSYSRPQRQSNHTYIMERMSYTLLPGDSKFSSLVVSYFSLPEWFDPDVGKGGYGFGKWPGELAQNVYNSSQVEPYTGRLEIGDWLRDEQFVKMKILAEKYETEIMVRIVIRTLVEA